MSSYAHCFLGSAVIKSTYRCTISQNGEPMNFQIPKLLMPIGRNTTLQIIICLVLIIFMSNLNAFVDAVLHPEIPYFDIEHLVVGGITGFVSAILFGLVTLYLRHLNKALKMVKTLESFLSICANCKSIRKPGSDPYKRESWQPLESYITEKTTTQFSHDICPECAHKLYPGYTFPNYTS